MSGLSRRHLLGTALAGSAVTFSGVAAAKIENPCKLPQKWDETHKVVIVGSGGAGLAVAVSAAQNGVKDIVVLEKMSYIGGNTAISGGAFNTTDHKRQPKQGIKDSPELHAEQTLKGGDFRANPALVHKMTENSEAALNWLEEMGVAFKPEVYQVYGALYPRSHDAVHSLGSDYIKVLKAQCDKLGIKIFTNSRVTGLIREQPLSGRVLGVEFEDSKKAKKYWKADIVVVCAGGFGANPKMRAKYDPRMLNLTTTNHVGATGDLIPLMEDIGADVIGMDHIQCNPGCPPGRKQRIVLHMHVEHLVMVDRKGQRFVAEEIRRSLQSQIPERKLAKGIKKRLRYTLLKRQKDLTEDERQKIDAISVFVPELKIAYGIKEDFFEIYDQGNRQDAEAAFANWESNLPTESVYDPFRNVANMVHNFYEPIFRYWDSNGLTNGYTECASALARAVDRRARGMRFNMLRGMLLYNPKALADGTIGKREYGAKLDYKPDQDDSQTSITNNALKEHIVASGALTEGDQDEN